MKNRDSANFMFGLGVVALIAIIILNLAVGGWSVDVILSWFGKDIPFLADSLIGLFTAEFSVPIAIVGKILLMFGIF